MDARVVTSEKCWSGIEEKMLEISREVNLINWLRIGHVSTLLEEIIGKVNLKILMVEKSWKTWRSNQMIVMDEELVQKIVMDEELVEKIVMDEELVEKIVMDAKVDPKVVMDLSILKIGGWNNLQPSNRKLLEAFIDENEPWLLIRIPSKDLFLRDTVLGTTLCEFRIST